MVAAIRNAQVANGDMPYVEAKYGKNSAPHTVLGKFADGEHLLTSDSNGDPHIIQNPLGQKGNRMVSGLTKEGLAKIPEVTDEELGLEPGSHAISTKVKSPSRTG